MKCQDPSPCSVRLQSTESLGTVHVLNGRCALAGETQEDHQELVDFVKVLFVLGLDLCLMALGLTFDPWSDRWVDLRPSLRTLFAMPGVFCSQSFARCWLGAVWLRPLGLFWL